LGEAGAGTGLIEAAGRVHRVYRVVRSAIKIVTCVGAAQRENVVDPIGHFAHEFGVFEFVADPGLAPKALGVGCAAVLHPIKEPKGRGSGGLVLVVDAIEFEQQSIGQLPVDRGTDQLPVDLLVVDGGVAVLLDQVEPVAGPAGFVDSAAEVAVHIGLAAAIVADSDAVQPFNRRALVDEVDHAPRLRCAKEKAREAVQDLDAFLVFDHGRVVVWTAQAVFCGVVAIEPPDVDRR